MIQEITFFYRPGSKTLILTMAVKTCMSTYVRLKLANIVMDGSIFSRPVLSYVVYFAAKIRSERISFILEHASGRFLIQITERM